MIGSLLPPNVLPIFTLSSDGTELKIGLTDERSCNKYSQCLDFEVFRRGDGKKVGFYNIRKWCGVYIKMLRENNVL